MRRLALLWMLLPAFALLPACGPAEEESVEDIIDESTGEEVTEDPADFGAGGKADSPAKALRFTFLQAGFFQKVASRGDAYDTAVALRYGYAARVGGAVQAETEVPIGYATTGANKSLVIVIPATRRTQFFAWKLKMKDWNGQTWWTEQHYASGKEPRGKFAAFPVENFAGYPFQNTCYSVRVRSADVWGPIFPGKVNNLFYGFTKSTLAQYNANNDVPWLSEAGTPGLVENLVARTTHNGGYKGTMILGRMFTRVPYGQNVAFKLNITKYDGQCGSSSGSFAGTSDTQTYFLRVP